MSNLDLIRLNKVAQELESQGATYLAKFFRDLAYSMKLAGG
jgi:hypothetical protein